MLYTTVRVNTFDSTLPQSLARTHVTVEVLTTMGLIYFYRSNVMIYENFHVTGSKYVVY